MFGYRTDTAYEGVNPNIEEDKKKVTEIARALRADGWEEVHDIAEGECDDTRGHHPCGPKGFARTEPGTFDQAIDHILVKNRGAARVLYFRRLTDEWFDKISDHYPLYIDLAL